MPDGTVAHFAEGSKLHKIKVFAGQGTKKPIRDVERLVKSYGGKPEDWMKSKRNRYFITQRRGKQSENSLVSG